MSDFLGMTPDSLRSFFNKHYATRVPAAPPQDTAPARPVMQASPPPNTATPTEYYDEQRRRWFAIPPDTQVQQPARPWGPVAGPSHHSGPSSSSSPWHQQPQRPADTSMDDDPYGHSHGYDGHGRDGEDHEEEDDPRPYSGKGKERSNRR